MPENCLQLAKKFSWKLSTRHTNNSAFLTILIRPFVVYRFLISTDLLCFLIVFMSVFVSLFYLNDTNKIKVMGGGRKWEEESPHYRVMKLVDKYKAVLFLTHFSYRLFLSYPFRFPHPTPPPLPFTNPSQPKFNYIEKHPTAEIDLNQHLYV